MRSERETANTRIATFRLFSYINSFVPSERFVAKLIELLQIIEHSAHSDVRNLDMQIVQTIARRANVDCKTYAPVAKVRLCGCHNKILE